LALGEWNVTDPGGLAEVMSDDQLFGWMAAYKLMPFGDEWLRDAVLMSQQYNAHRPKGRKALEPWDFMPTGKRQQSQEEMLRILAAAKAR
jgi:hypothetical protein